MPRKLKLGVPASAIQKLSSQAISALRMSLLVAFAISLAQADTPKVPVGVYSANSRMDIVQVVDLDAPEVAVPLKRHYWPVKIAQVPQTKHTHIQVTGKVTLVKREQDGDLHIRISDGKGKFVVGECIPSLPCDAPKKGDMVRVQGISREDKEHGWFEVHPIESLEILH